MPSTNLPYSTTLCLTVAHRVLPSPRWAVMDDRPARSQGASV